MRDVNDEKIMLIIYYNNAIIIVYVPRVSSINQL